MPAQRRRGKRFSEVHSACENTGARRPDSPVRVEREDPAVAESGASTISTAFFSNFRVQEFSCHQACQDLETEKNAAGRAVLNI